jgi:hypothetical protein
VPVAAHTSLIACANAGDIGRTPPSPWIGSAMIAAVRSVTAARSDSGFAGSTKVTGPISG